MNTIAQTVPMAKPSPDGHDTLPIGSRLDEFEVQQVLGIGGFGIVYLAIDHSLHRQVAIKEYMPIALAVRADGALVSLRSASHAETFEMGLQSFINEARLLAQFDHPSLVKVYRYWEANGTAYMAMQYYPGSTLKDERPAMSRVPDETWLRGIIDPLLGALEVLHGANVYHRDISPDNIVLLPDGRPVLLDFGAARRVIGDRTQTLTAILKPNYAPVEQYPDTGMRQGPWTDLYALAAVTRFMLTGQPPPPATARAVRDEMQPLAGPGSAPAANPSLSFLSAIDWALALRPQDRPHSVQVFRDALNGEFMPPGSPAWMSFDAPLPMPANRHGGTPAARDFANSRNSKNVSTQPRTGVGSSSPPRTLGWRSRAIATLATAALGMVAVGIWAPKSNATHAAGAPSATAAPVESPRRVAAQQPEMQGFTERSGDASTRVGTAPDSPRQVCTERGAPSMPACVSRECRRPYFREHPQCQQLREAMARQQEQKAR